ncbi:metallophosphoesterase family protein [Persicimonas caeni]|uniref:Metallophosphoesterase family protein n=1 Tax=Persicimonas caeni TaxID=2292766 RepID=A0A4Y6PYI2_PERCE|nr:metallophosphoesterase family protein [Persicimonas caeni]QDG53388.1 metallophosphoesterase family protein [Persicimonas caeni]QED34609.1 metallophosphoesterase family protein [Persicimonas caeni]
MIIGIFSDVHSNLEAMTTVREAYEEDERDIDMYVCLGDVVGYGACPNECCDIVREMAEITILGNHDAAVCGRMNYAFYYDAARNALDWHAEQLREEHHEWLKSLPYSKTWEDVEFCHGSPVNREDFEYVFNIHQANGLIDHWDDLQHITFIGHSHLTKAFSLHPEEGAVEISGPLLEFEDDKKYIVTVGSVGQPRDNDNRACFGFYDTEAKTFEYQRRDYDVRSAAKKIFQSELSSDFAKRLFFGI